MGKKRRQTPAPVIPPQPTASLSPAMGFGISGGNRPAFDLWRPMASDANGAAEYSLLDQRAASRELSRTDPVASAGVNRWAEYVIGRGLRLQSQVDLEELGISEGEARDWQNRTERRFRMWSEDVRSSVEGDKNFYQLQRIAAYSAKDSGDVFAVLTSKDRPGWPFKTAIQLIEADRVSNENNGANTAELFEGIQRKADGEIKSIWVANHHPYTNHLPSNRRWKEIPLWTRSGRKNIVQWKKMNRPGQSRGIPLPSIITGTLKQIGRYTDAEIDAAVLSATQVLIAQMSPESFNDLFNNPDEKAKYMTQAFEARQNGSALSSGGIVNTFPDETITNPTPGRPNPNAPPFLEMVLGITAMGFGMSPEILIGKFTTSFTAAQAAFQQWFQTVFIDRDDAISDFCQPIYETWLHDCVVDGIIQAPGFLADAFIRAAYCRSIWKGSGKFVLNPLQEAKAAELRAQFITTEAEEASAYDGGDYETRHRQRAREASNRRADDMPPLGTQAMPEAPDPADDSSSPEDDPAVANMEP